MLIFQQLQLEVPAAGTRRGLVRLICNHVMSEDVENSYDGGQAIMEMIMEMLPPPVQDNLDVLDAPAADENNVVGEEEYRNAPNLLDNEPAEIPIPAAEFLGFQPMPRREPGGE